MNRVFKFPIIVATALSIIAGATFADTKIGMITTLSGGGAGLGVDVRDGFMLAINQSGRSDIDVIIDKHMWIAFTQWQVKISKSICCQSTQL
jgi:hypothetical protein